MADNDNYSLRPEAGPVPYDKLQWRAQDGLRLMIRALKAAASNAAKEPGPDEVHSIDTNRTNQIFFVSGEPGSGKSTLYLTLRAMLSSQYKEEYRRGYTEDDLSKLGEEAVRWLDPIDLEVAGDEGENLLAAVLVRLSRELEESQSGFSSACSEAIKDLSELAADIGMAWEGNLQARGGELDPDAYSMEVMRAQRAKLGVNKRLRKALNKLAKEKCYGCHQGTLFVLPVDDFYLKPNASLLLLRLLRMISVPRLFFLVMGDIKTVEALFVEKALADWTAVAGPEVFAALPDRKQEVLGWARELRARFLRKLLPPSQRANVEPMDWHEAMRFKPHRLNDESGDELRSLLAQVDFDPPWTSDPSTPPLEQTNPKGELLDLLTCGLKEQDQDKVIKEAGKEKEKEAREAYTGLQILDATPRETMDLWIALHEYISSNVDIPSPRSNQQKNEPKRPRLLSLVVKFAQLAIEEQSFLDEERQKQLSGVLPTRTYYATDIYLEMDRLSLEPESISWKDKYKKSSSRSEVWVRKHSPWKLTVAVAETIISNKKDEGEQTREDKLQEKQGTKRDPFAKLPPRPTAWIILLHDLAWKWRQESVSVNLVVRLRNKLEPRINSAPTTNSNGQRDALPPPDFGWVAWKDGEAWKHFPLPEFVTFQELDRFLRVWNSGLDWFRRDPELDETHPRDIDDLIDLWALAGLTVIGNHYDAFAARDSDWPEEQLNDFTIAVGKRTFTPDEKAWLDIIADFRTDMGIVAKKASKKPARSKSTKAALSKTSPKRTSRKNNR
jgi:hypothetical protein